jgi:pimeloyl-[acyl-carrier protein] methyl ester esterase
MMLLFRFAVMAIALASSLYTMTIGTEARADTQGPRLFPDAPYSQGERFSVEVLGHGPDIIFIPGLASSRAVWKATAERLKSKYRVHLIQVSGFAGEPARGNASGPVLVPTAEAIDAYIVANHLAPATVVGHSLGGTMALWLAECHPEHLKKILVADALPFFGLVFGGAGATEASMKPMADIIRASATTSREDASDAILNTMVTAPTDKATLIAWSHASDKSAVANAMADDITTDLRPTLGAIKVPATLLYPASSADGAYAQFYAMAPQIKRVRIDNSLHFIMLDQPEAFAKELDAFLAA